MHGRYEFFGLPYVIPNTVNFHFGTSRLRFCELALTHVYFYLPKKSQPPSGKTQSIARNSINWNGCLSIISYTTFARGIIVYHLNMFTCPTKYRYSDISLIYRRVRTSPYFASASHCNASFSNKYFWFLLSLVIFHGSCRLCNISYVTVITFRRSALIKDVVFITALLSNNIKIDN